MFIFETKASDYAAEFVNVYSNEIETYFVVLGFTDYDQRGVGTVVLRTTNINRVVEHYATVVEGLSPLFPNLYDMYKLAVEPIPAIEFADCQYCGSQTDRSSCVCDRCTKQEDWYLG